MTRRESGIKASATWEKALTGQKRERVTRFGSDGNKRRKRGRDISGTSSGETSGSEDNAELRGPWEMVEGLKAYTSFVLGGQVYEIGDNVSLRGSGHQEWYCKITKIFADPDSGEAMFEGRWYWTPYDVNRDSNTPDLVPIHSESDHELLLSDQSDTNSCATIKKKARIVNRERYEAYLAKNGDPRNLYYCCQHYYAMMHIVRYLNSWEYCFDPLSDEDVDVMEDGSNTKTKSKDGAELNGDGVATVRNQGSAGEKHSRKLSLGPSAKSSALTSPEPAMRTAQPAARSQAEPVASKPAASIYYF